MIQKRDANAPCMDDVRRLVLHLMNGVSEHPKNASLTDSEELLTNVVRLTPDLVSIVEVGSKDASMLGAMRTKKTPLNYLLLHHGTDHTPAQLTIERLGTVEGFEAAMNTRSYPRELRGKRRAQARSALHERIRTYDARLLDVQNGWYRKGFPLVHEGAKRSEVPFVTPPASLVVRDPSLIESGRFGSIDDVLTAARHKGYANALLMLPPEHDPIPEPDVRGDTQSGTFAGYRLKRSDAPVGDVYTMLIEGIMGATSNRP